MKRYLYILLLALISLNVPAQKVVQTAMGDPISDYYVYLEQYPEGSALYRIYQSNKSGQKIRQVVVTTKKWTNAPDSILDGGGYRLEALSPNEYKEYKERGKIWGELFGFRKNDPNGAGLTQFEVYQHPSIYPQNALELMYFEYGGKLWFTAAPNKIPYYKEYNLDWGDTKIYTPEEYKAYMESQGY